MLVENALLFAGELLVFSRILLRFGESPFGLVVKPLIERRDRDCFARAIQS